MWHRATRELRESGKLQVVGIVQEQHPERARLYAQWQELDWPILWDPLNLTGSAAVPRVTLLDEHGVVRSRRPSPETIAELVAEEHPVPEGAASTVAVDGPGLLPLFRLAQDDPAREHWSALTDALEGVDVERAVGATQQHLERDPEDARARFRLGVLSRMRHDAGQEPFHFAAAIEAWTEALRRQPRQYIWRRRIQQYGPLLDKPYPFYPWIDEARDAVRARGDVPVELPTVLSTSERAARRGDAPWPESPYADMDAYTRALEPAQAPEGRVGLETVVVRDTDSRRRVLRLYVGVRGRPGVRWAGPLGLRFAPGEARPAAWALELAPGGDVPLGVQWLEVDVKLPEGGPVTLIGDVTVSVREGEEAAPRTVRVTFTLTL